MISFNQKKTNVISINNSPIQTLQHPLFEQYKVDVDIKRDDLLHPIISGNKWRKLKYLIEDAQSKDCDTIISMGGNWSNHLHALAFVGKELGLKTVGCVRASANQELTTTLLECQEWGMELRFTSRENYAQLRKHTEYNYLSEQYPNSYWLSEGGFSQLAINGVQDIGQEVEQYYDYVLVGCGSGATVLGLSKAFPKSKIIGVAAFKGAEYLADDLKQYSTTGFFNKKNWQLDFDHHCGGFAKINQHLMKIKADFEGYNGFDIDRVYNAKVMYALLDYLGQEKIVSGDKVLLINTGGIQGDRSII